MYYKLYQSLHSILNDTRFRPTWGFFIGDFMKTNQDKFLTFKEQVQLFKDRGMIIEDEEKAERVLQFINYYKIKECSLPFFKIVNIYRILLLMKYLQDSMKIRI